MKTDGFPEGETGLSNRIVAEARRWLGTPYVHQTSMRGAGADCLGLVRGIWREVVGDEPFAPPSYTKDWSEASGREALMAAADTVLLPRRADTLFLGAVLLFRMRDRAVAKHLGVVSQTGPDTRFIHAYSGYGVVESSLSGPWRKRIARIYEFPGGAG